MRVLGGEEVCGGSTLRSLWCGWVSDGNDERVSQWVLDCCELSCFPLPVIVTGL